MVIRYFYPLRYICLIVVVSAFFGSALMLYIGVIETLLAFEYAFSSEHYVELESGLEVVKAADLVTSYIIKAMDSFLIALVLMIFSYGVYLLFISSESDSETRFFKWLHIPDISHLKNTLAEVIVVILFVKFLEIILLNLSNLAWEMLILPASILLLALSLKFLDLRQ
jgi:uncharacterized membrane protein YqhA